MDAGRILGGVFAALMATSVATLATPGGERASGIADQQRVDVTVYNGTLALVHDRRRITLTAGDNRIAWRDVGASMDPTTAILSDLSEPGAVSVVEQNFDYDVLQPSSLIAKYVGKRVLVWHPSRDGQPPRTEPATILSDTQGIVLQYADRIETDLNGGYLQFPALPPDLRDRPTLVLDLSSAHAGPARLDLAYITGGLDWHADYVGVVSADRRTLDLQGLVTLQNTSGTTFRNAHMQLVAGNVHAPPLATGGFQPGQTQDTYTVSGQRQVQEENYFEYHLYTLSGTTTIANNQTKQVALLSAHRVPIHETLELRGDDGYYRAQNADLGDKLKVGAYVTFTNRGGELGIPLPGGNVRLYENDSRGTSLYLGGDVIDHTPRNEDVRLHVGDSFDVTANKKQTDFHGIDACTADSSYRIVVKNAKTTPVDVLVVEPIPGEWSISSNNLPYVKSSSSTANWNLRVPADGSTTLTYTARVRYCL